MAVKLLMSWDISPGREQEYFEFVVREFIPGMQRLGLEPTDAWFTMYGEDQPQILTGAQISNKQALERILGSPEWKNLTDQLSNYVEDFSTKIVPARKGFQM
ncbi:MAG TPA: hypothetical protein VE136_03490 [Anaerolineales bacterium]|nr:hypothetical protein [Anaerolineales bacterium]